MAHSIHNGLQNQVKHSPQQTVSGSFCEGRSSEIKVIDGRYQSRIYNWYLRTTSLLLKGSKQAMQIPQSQSTTEVSELK